ncbi:hypothetical protein AB0L10_25940 [Streptomyces flaveolus]|uniref:hypothetical protein n=1 Tax=Streptomyces flaveolus TaxID=67297 RepID=UPI0034265369
MRLLSPVRPLSPVRRSTRTGGTLAAAVALVLCGGAAFPAQTSAPAHTAPPGDTGYTVTVGTPVPFGHPTDTPATPYLDKDGTFHYQQSAALYGADDPRVWDFYTGKDFDSATFDRTLSEAVNPADVHGRRCLHPRQRGDRPAAGCRLREDGRPRLGRRAHGHRGPRVIPGSAADGTYRLVNRYSGLVLGLSATTGRLAETTPPRTWTDTTGGTVGGGRTAAEQTLSFSPVGR